MHLKNNSFDISGLTDKIEPIISGFENPMSNQEKIVKGILKDINNYGVQYIK